VTTYRVGERLIGVRTNDAELGVRLRELLRAHVVPEIEAPPNVSLLVGADDGRVRDFHRLYRGSSPAIRTRSRIRLMRAAVTHLDAFAEPPGGTFRVNARVLVRDGTATLVDPALGSMLEQVERRLEQLGYRVADIVGAPLDDESLELALWPPRLEVDHAALADLDREDPHKEREVSLTSSRVPIRALILWCGNSDHDGSPAERLVSVVRLVAPSDGSPVGSQDLALAQRMAAAWTVWSCPGEDAALLRLLRDTADR
jgi:hypothetical protein